MNTYYLRVTTGRERLMKVEADSRHEAEAAAAERMEDDLRSYPQEGADILTADADVAFDDDVDDSIIARVYGTSDGQRVIRYDLAGDDPTAGDA